ncbi:MAG: carbohydrate ABC transporter permease [Lachnospiraceae bacterium]
MDKKRNRFHITPYLFISPVFILLAALVVYPICYALYLSIMDTNLTTRWDFVGLKNYLSLLKNGNMIKSLIVTFQFTIVVVAGHLVVGTILALAMNKKRPGVALFRTILIIPWLLPDVVVALLFKWIFNANYGVFNNIMLRLGLIEKNQAWLSTSMAFVILAGVCIWKGYALIMVNIMAGLQSVPEDIYEAAKLDGAKPIQTFFRITVPTIKPVIATSVILDTVWWFKHYTIIKLLTDGGPGNATSTVSTYIQKEAFTYHNYGIAAAEAGVVFIVCWLISKVMRRVMDSNE